MADTQATKKKSAEDRGLAHKEFELELIRLVNAMQAKHRLNDKEIAALLCKTAAQLLM